MTTSSESASCSLVHDHIPCSPHESTTVETKSYLYALKNSSAAEGSKRAHRLERLWTWIATDSWTLEYAALTIAVASLASIGILLGVYGEQPTSIWTHTITLNSVLSTLATVMKGSMSLPVGACLSQLKWTWYHHEKRSLLHFRLFDAASRGPMGAASLLYQIHSWHLASIGAIVTLMALASDAFVQQSVTYPLRTINETASVPCSWSYDLLGAFWRSPPSRIIKNGSISIYEAERSIYEVEQSMKAAIYDAIYDAIYHHNASVTGAAVSANCPTGNCTFPDYASMAVCSRCRDVTTSIEDVCIPVNTTGAWKPDCTMQATLPNGLTIRNGDAETYTKILHTTI